MIIPKTQTRLPSYTVAELRAIVEETHTHDRKVTAHCHAVAGMAR